MIPSGSQALGIEEQLQALRQKWLSHGITVRCGVSAAQIAEFERRHGVQLPFATRRFYELMDGMGNCETDEELNCFWPLHEIGTVPDRLSDFRGVPDYSGIETTLPDAASCFVFADHSIWLQVYAVKLSQEGNLGPVYAICGAKHVKQIAASFANFIELYAANPVSVSYPPYD
jgi:hypothetical protein